MNTTGFESLETPALLLDTARMDRNIERMRARLARHGVAFRPHVKTNKCMEVTQRLLDAGARGITVSTLREAEYFSERGITDILYAVCMSPNKLAHALRLRRQGVRLTVIVDNVEMALQLNPDRLQGGDRLDVLIEIDCDGHRSGVQPEAPELLAIATALQSQGLAVGRPDARWRLLQLPLGSRARGHRRTGARGRRPRCHPPARCGARLSGGERGLHTHRTVCGKPRRRDRSARRRVRVFRSRDGRHRRLPHR